MTNKNHHVNPSIPKDKIIEPFDVERSREKVGHILPKRASDHGGSRLSAAGMADSGAAAPGTDRSGPELS